MSSGAHRNGWRLLVGFWMLVLIGVAGGLATLQYLGPIPPQVATAGEHPSVPQQPITSAHATPPAAGLVATSPAAGDPRPRVAILLVGIGLAEAESRRAIELPGAVSLAVSPYAAQPTMLLDAMRQHGHEYLLSLPLEPASFPLNDAGPRALLTGAPASRNDENLSWVLGRITGEVGATGALDGLRGERFAAVPTLFNPVLAELDRRGLFYIDPRPGRPAPREIASRAIDLVLDDPPGQAEIDLRLQQLEQIAQDHGTAIGLAGPPRPVLLDRLAAWTTRLEARGLVLVPVSQLVSRPSSTIAADLTPPDARTQ